MEGIVSYGVYVPIYRLGGEILNQVWGGNAKGEKAIANADEDSLTIGVEAARDCLMGMDRGSINALYFASTTFPFKEKQSASIMAAALDLSETIVTADIGSSLRCGTIALAMALDAVRAGSANMVVVVVSDCRLPYPNSAYEPILGDGAAAFLIGKDKVVAEIEATCHITSEFIDNWRLEYDKGVKSWEERFINEEGYVPHLRKAISNLVKAHGLDLKDFSKVVFPAITERAHRVVANALQLNPNQVQNPFFNTVGNTGAAFAPMMLVGALEEAQAADRILLANYGDGADACVFRVTREIERLRDRKGLKKHIDSKLMLDNYGRYIKFRNLMELEPTFENPSRAALTNTWRERKSVYRLHGYRCDKCGKVQFPRQKYCMYCHADERDLIEVPLADKKGTLVTFSIDERSPVVDPPNVLAAVNLEDGGRFFSQMTDRDTKELKVGMPVELTFRKIHDGLGVHNYFWKCKPLRERSKEAK
jgi:3-hydroxy-3-methylglutaryl CoA synthase